MVPITILVGVRTLVVFLLLEAVLPLEALYRVVGLIETNLMASRVMARRMVACRVLA